MKMSLTTVGFITGRFLGSIPTLLNDAVTLISFLFRNLIRIKIHRIHSRRLVSSSDDESGQTRKNPT